MNALANAKKGAAAKAITCLLECTLGTQFEAFLDEAAIKEIADVVKFEIDFDPMDRIDLQTPEESKQSPSKEGRPEKSYKVCIVENDIKLTEDEKEVLKEMLAEKKREHEEHAAKGSPAKAKRTPKK